ncbi:MAG: ribonuclease HII [Candidatus Pacebacteria bacterium]|nr:ribonuclease HII [Candidatus Paceibacterota bacterium]
MKKRKRNQIKRDKWRYIIGVDEAGRGPLAGPVVAVAITKLKTQDSKLKTTTQNLKLFKNLKLKDSKKLSPQKREEIFEMLKNHPQIVWERGLVSAKIIDKINIWSATKLAMKRAIKNLEKKLKKHLPKNKTLIIIDGNLKIESGFSEVPVIKADQKIPECILASIFAKVIRDRLMVKYDKIYPEYNFKKHKGYPTKEHKKLLKKYNPCLLHRKSFKIK